MFSQPKTVTLGTWVSWSWKWSKNGPKIHWPLIHFSRSQRFPGQRPLARCQSHKLWSLHWGWTLQVTASWFYVKNSSGRKSNDPYTPIKLKISTGWYSSFHWRVKFFHRCPKWRSHVFKFCWLTFHFGFPGSTFLVAKSRWRIPRWCKQPVASSTSKGKVNGGAIITHKTQKQSHQFFYEKWNLLIIYNHFY